MINQKGSGRKRKWRDWVIQGKFSTVDVPDYIWTKHLSNTRLWHCISLVGTVKVKSPLCLITQLRRMSEWTYSSTILTSALDGGEASSLRPGTHYIGGWVGPRAGLGAMQSLAPVGTHPARNRSLYRLSYSCCVLYWNGSWFSQHVCQLGLFCRFRYNPNPSTTNRCIVGNKITVIRVWTLLVDVKRDRLTGNE
jgi:hypothetical protein